MTSNHHKEIEPKEEIAGPKKGEEAAKQFATTLYLILEGQYNRMKYKRKKIQSGLEGIKVCYVDSYILPF